MSVKKNTISLFLIQALNYILPLITLPFISRIYGPEEMGKIAIGMAFAGFASIIADFGFGVTGVKLIATNRNNLSSISNLYYEITAAKTLVVFPVIFIYFILTYINLFGVNTGLHIIYSIPLFLANTYSPLWLMQGLEVTNKSVAPIIFSKILYVALIYLFIDYNIGSEMVILIAGVTTFVSTIICIKRIFLYTNKRTNKTSLKLIFCRLNESRSYFASTIAVSAYSANLILLLGIFFDQKAIGLFSAAEKIVQAIKGLFSPLLHATFPIICRKIVNNKLDAMSFHKILVVVFGFIALLICGFVLAGSELIINLIFGDAFTGATKILQIMSVIPLMVVLSNLFGIQGLFAFGFEKLYSKLTIYLSFFSVFSIALVSQVQLIDFVVWWIVFIEILVFVIMFLNFRKHLAG